MHHVIKHERLPFISYIFIAFPLMAYILMFGNREPLLYLLNQHLIIVFRSLSIRLSLNT